MSRFIGLIVIAAVCAVLLLPPANAAQDDGAAPGVQAAFRAKYDAWLKVRGAVLQGPSGASGVFDVEAVYNNDAFRSLIALGLPAVPYMIQAVHSDSVLGYGLFLITKWRYHEIRNNEDGVSLWTVEEYPDIRQRRAVDAVAMWERWWREGPKAVDDRYRALKGRWDMLRVENTPLWTSHTWYSGEDQAVHEQRDNVTEAGKEYMAVQDLGIAALPLLATDLREGRLEFLDIAVALAGGGSELSGSSLPATTRAKAFLAWWDQHKQDWLIPWPDAAGQTPAPPAGPAAGGTGTQP